MQALSDCIKEIRNDSNISIWNEAQAREWIIRPILDLLGWGRREITPEYGVGTRRVDYALEINGDNEVFIEAKKPQVDLENHQEQLLDYSFKEGVDLAILTNGIAWWFYLPLKKGAWNNRKFYTINILKQDIEDIVEKFDLLLSRQNVASGESVQQAESILENRQREKIIKERLPDAWDKVIKNAVSPDSLLVDLLAETAEEVCGFKLESDEILRFIRDHYKKWLLSPELKQEAAPPTTRPIATTRSLTKKQTEGPKRIQNDSKNKGTMMQTRTEVAEFRHRVLLININRQFKAEALWDEVYEATRFAWKVSKSKAEKAEVILTTYQGEIRAAFVADEWLEATPENFPSRCRKTVLGRFGFIGCEASPDIQNLYVGKRVPDEYRKRGAANPIRYVNC